MALGSMGTMYDIISGGDDWKGRTNAQIACLFISQGLLDQIGDEIPPEDIAKGLGRFGFSFSMN